MDAGENDQLAEAEPDTGRKKPPAGKKRVGKSTVPARLAAVTEAAMLRPVNLDSDESGDGHGARGRPLASTRAGINGALKTHHGGLGQHPAA